MQPLSNRPCSGVPRRAARAGSFIPSSLSCLATHCPKCEALCGDKHGDLPSSAQGREGLELLDCLGYSVETD